MNYKLSEIAAVVGGKFTGCDAEVRSVVTDSRSLSCELGCCPMFVAMRVEVKEGINDSILINDA